MCFVCIVFLICDYVLRILYYCSCFFFQAEDGIRDLVRSRGLGDVYKRQDYVITPANIDDRNAVWDLCDKYRSISIIGDKGYILSLIHI